MLGSKWLGEIIKEEGIELGSNTLIIAPTGSGKTHYILNDLCTDDKKCLYICDTNNLKYSVNYEIANKKHNIVVLNYHQFGKIVSGLVDNDYIEQFDYIIGDEAHNLINFQNIDNNGYLMASRMKLFDKYEHCKIVLFTATPEAINKLANKHQGIDKNFECYDFSPYNYPEIKRYTEKRLSYIGHYTDVDREFREYENYFKLGNQCLIFTSKIGTMKEIENICSKYDYLRPISIWADKKPMTDEQKDVRKHLLEQHELKSDYNVLIINKATETGINIENWDKDEKPHKMNLMICNSVDKTEQIQSRGRIRHDIDFLIFKSKDMKQLEFSIDEDILDKWWSKGLIQEFVITKNNMRDDKSRFITVNKLNKELEKYGYVMESKKVRDKDYYARTGKDKKVTMYKISKK